MLSLNSDNQMVRCRKHYTQLLSPEDELTPIRRLPIWQVETHPQADSSLPVMGSSVDPEPSSDTDAALMPRTCFLQSNNMQLCIAKLLH